MEMKKCVGVLCKGRLQPLDKFGKNRTKKDGLCTECRPCSREHQKQYRQKNKEKVKTAQEKHRNKPENKEKGYIYQKNYYKKNKTEILAKNRIYYENNKDKIKAINDEWKKNNPEKVRVAKQKWRKNNPEKVNTNTRKRRAMQKNVNENYTTQDKNITFIVFNNECFKCKAKDIKLIPDHHLCLNDGHALTVENAVPLCKSCNSSKWAKKPEEFYIEEELKEIQRLFTKAKKLKDKLIKQGKSK